MFYYSRYSPGRLSLRKAGTSLIESTLGNKKAEALMEGFSQLKSVAAVTARKKIDEFKEVIATSGYATTKNGPFGYVGPCILISCLRKLKNNVCRT